MPNPCRLRHPCPAPRARRGPGAGAAERCRCPAPHCCDGQCATEAFVRARRSNWPSVTCTSCASTAPSDKTVPLVDREIIFRPRKQARHLFDLKRVFVDVRGETQPPVLPPAMPGSFKHGFAMTRARSGESPRSRGGRGHEPSISVRSHDTRPGRLMQFRPQQPVCQHQPAENTQALSRRPEKAPQSHPRNGTRRPVRSWCHSPREQSRIPMQSGSAPDIGQTRFFRQSQLVQPVEQRIAQARR